MKKTNTLGAQSDLRKSSIAVPGLDEMTGERMPVCGTAGCGGILPAMEFQPPRRDSVKNPERRMLNNIFTQIPALPAQGKYILRLYIAGNTPQSSRAITNLKAICETHLQGRYDLTVVDLYEQQERAYEDHIIVAPTLVRHSPLPVRRMIGDLSKTDRVLAALDLPMTPNSR
jgi:circadian clock protein KaiB